jgi:uncharacterized cupredoxin-like copper-binding protein
MKRIPLLFAAVLTVLLAAACGGAAPAATQAPSASVSGTEVDVTLEDNTIESTLTTFQVGVPYTFVIINTGRHAHNFNISQPVSVAGSLDAALQTALVAVPQQELGPGETATAQLTFPEAAMAQQWEFSCLIRRHYDDGMRLAITIVK